MTAYEQLVKALRLCQFGECGCGKCYYKKLKGDWCTEDNHPEFFDCDDKLKLDAAAAIEALQAQLPKRGEWIYHPKDAIEMMFTLPKCSICGHESSDALNYCPNCGAKMEAQE